jgi:tRNA(Ile)-lysidine synthetase-like protein
LHFFSNDRVLGYAICPQFATSRLLFFRQKEMVRAMSHRVPNASPPPALPYAKAGPLGGRLIREVVAFLRSQNISLPLSSHILIATSGGSDSVGLAHLLVHYGRRIIDRSQISLVHVNHGWRGVESNRDEDFVESLGRDWSVPVISHRVKPPSLESTESWEELARAQRKKIFAADAKKKNAVIFTGHQADDLAETVLWRLFTGAAKTHGGGVAFQHGVEFRPLLKTRKTLIQAYLREVGVSFKEDSTNFSERFMRARMRTRLMPEAEKLFPRMVDHLVTLALGAQKQNHETVSEGKSQEISSREMPEILFEAAGLKPRRSHLELISEKLVAKQPWYGEIHLPGGWKLIRDRGKLGKKISSNSSYRQKIEHPVERWILEKI